MTNQDEFVLATDKAEPDPTLLALTEQITAKLQAGERVNIAEYVNRYPQWAGPLRRLLPTMCDLVNFGRAVNRDRRPGPRPVVPEDANGHKA